MLLVRTPVVISFTIMEGFYRLVWVQKLLETPSEVRTAVLCWQYNLTWKGNVDSHFCSPSVSVCPSLPGCLDSLVAEAGKTSSIHSQLNSSSVEHLLDNNTFTFSINTHNILFTWWISVVKRRRWFMISVAEMGDWEFVLFYAF